MKAVLNACSTVNDIIIVLKKYNNSIVMISFGLELRKNFRFELLSVNRRRIRTV
jgi:hypothetical protein